jgi:ATP-binding cassette, subfamily C, bacterial CydC
VNRPPRPVRRYLRLLAYRPLVVLGAGIAIAVAAEASAVALLGLSGWFLASCYLAGLSVTSTFSYLVPSGTVQVLALSRTGTGYSQRLVGHDAVLRWLTRIRVQLFDDAAARPAAVRELRDGEVLDRAMVDADVLSETLIRSLQRIAVTLISAAGACALAGLVYAPLAAAFAVGAAATTVAATVGSGDDGAARTAASHRGRARAELVAAVQAWPELMSLGAAAQLREATRQQLGRLAAASDRYRGRQSRSQTLVDLVAGATLAGMCAVILAGHPGLGIPRIALLLLLSAGVLDLLKGLPDAWRAAAGGRDAAGRLAVLADRGTARQGGPSRDAARPGGSAAILPQPPGLQIDGLRLPGQPRAERGLTVCLPPGAILIVTGRSGSGKTTLLRAINGEVEPVAGSIRIGSQAPSRVPAGQVVFVEHDDYVFAGTVADNLRLADPSSTPQRALHLLQVLCLHQAGITAETHVGATGRALSGGERRRLVLARAVAADPAVLLLDEPTEGLDPATARRVLASLRYLLPATTLVIAMHDKHAALVPAGWGLRLSLDQDGSVLGGE